MIASAVAVLAALCASVALFWSARERRAQGGDPLAPALGAGAALAALLMVQDGGSLLSWVFRAGTGVSRAALPGVGVLLGLTLVCALAGSLLLGAQRLAGGADAARPVAVGLLWAAAAGAAIGLGVAVVQAGMLPGEGLASGAGVLVAGAAVTLALAVALFDAPRPVPVAEAAASRALLATRLAAGLAVLAALAAGIEGYWRQGTYVTPATLAAAAAALLGLAALEPTRLTLTRRLLLLAALVGLVVRGG